MGQMGSTARKRNTTNWSTVPADVLGLIATNITSAEDYYAFGAVCKWWRCAAIENKTSIDLSSSPWLMKTSNANSDTRVFYSFTGDKLFDLELTELRGRMCFGSAYGWLVTFRSRKDTLRSNIILFNPLSKASIPLPDLVDNRDCSEFSVHKAILTANPGSPDCFVVVRYRYGNVAFARPGDPVWSPIKTPNIADIVYFKGNVYGCGFDGRLFVFDLSSGKEPPDIAAAFAPSPRKLHYPHHHSNYLVELGTQLCLVNNIILINPTSKNRDFEIYSIDMETREWKRVESLGQWCLVYEDYATFFSVDPVAAKHKELLPGHIYCANLDRFGTKVWNVEKRRLLYWHAGNDIYSRLFPTIRITPSLLP